MKGSAQISIASQTINSNAAAHSQIFRADFGLKPGIDIMSEVAIISDGEGSSELDRIGIVRRFAQSSSRRLSLSGFTGITQLEVNDNYESTRSRIGIMFGLAADYEAHSLVKTYTSISVAQLAQALWTVDAGIKYSFRPNWELLLGYRTYSIGGSSLGGPVAGITYGIQR